MVWAFLNQTFPSFIFPGFFNLINKFRFKSLLIQKKIGNIYFSHSHVSYPAAYLTGDLECTKIIQHHGLDVLQLMNGDPDLLDIFKRCF